MCLVTEIYHGWRSLKSFRFLVWAIEGVINLCDILDERISFSKSRMQSLSVWCTFWSCRNMPTKTEFPCRKKVDIVVGVTNKRKISYKLCQTFGLTSFSITCLLSNSINEVGTWVVWMNWDKIRFFFV